VDLGTGTGDREAVSASPVSVTITPPVQRKSVDKGEFLGALHALCSLKVPQSR